MNYDPFYAFPGAVLECAWEHILWSGKCLPEQGKKKDQSMLAQTAERVGRAPPGEVWVGVLV